MNTRKLVYSDNNIKVIAHNVSFEYNTRHNNLGVILLCSGERLPDIRRKNHVKI
jgi:hypothetical protein